MGSDRASGKGYIVRCNQNQFYLLIATAVGGSIFLVKTGSVLSINQHLGYTFRPRLNKNKEGKFFVGFTPAVSEKAKTAMKQKIREWKIQLKADLSLKDIAHTMDHTMDHIGV